MGANKTMPDQYQLRFPPGLRDRLKRVASLNSRSLNAEIIARLEGALARENDGSFRINLPNDLLKRILHDANDSELDPNLLIINALETAFPAEIPTFGELVDRLQNAVDAAGEDASEEDLAYLTSARMLIAKDPGTASERFRVDLHDTRNVFQRRPWADGEKEKKK